MKTKNVLEEFFYAGGANEPHAQYEFLKFLKFPKSVPRDSYKLDL